MSTETEKARDFIREEIDNDLKSGRYQGVITRFPPEPNAYLTIGNAKAICINFGIAEENQRSRLSRWIDFMQAGSWDELYPNKK